MGVWELGVKDERSATAVGRKLRVNEDWRTRERLRRTVGLSVNSETVEEARPGRSVIIS